MHISWYICVSLALIASVLIGRIGQVDSQYFYLSAIVLLPALILLRHNRRVVIGIVVTIISSVLIARTAQTLPPPDFDPDQFSHYQLTFTGDVESAPRQTTKSTQVILNNVTVMGDELKNEATWFGRISMTLPRHIDIKYGDRVEATSKLQSISQIEDEGYRQYLQNHNIFGTLVWPDSKVVSRGGGNKVVAWGINVQSRLNEQYQRVLPKDAAGFLSGVVLGSKQELSEDFEKALKTTGTTHIIVASGYNISVLIGILIKIFGHLRKSTLALIVITMLVCFVVISGLDASIIRASIMATLGIIATMLGRQHQALYGLVIAAVLMLIINPLWLLDTGFQLSYLATTGIVLFQTSILKYVSGLPSWISDSLSTTIAAQILVLPILVVTFGKISVISILTNVLVLWITPWLMFGGIALACLLIVSQPVGRAATFVVYPMFWYIKKMIMLTSMFPFAVLPLKVSWSTTALWYAVIFAMYGRIIRHADAQAS